MKKWWALTLIFLLIFSTTSPAWAMDSDKQVLPSRLKHYDAATIEMTRQMMEAPSVNGTFSPDGRSIITSDGSTILLPPDMWAEWAQREGVGETPTAGNVGITATYDKIYRWLSNQSQYRGISASVTMPSSVWAGYSSTNQKYDNSG